MRRPTLEALARHAGVGLSTVDRVLNGRSAVREETARRVLEAAEAIGFYATPLLRQRLKADVPERRFAVLLQQRATAFYDVLGRALEAAVAERTDIRGRAAIEFMEDLAPAAVAERIRRAGRNADGIAVVAADHQLVNAAIDEVGARVPVVALISDLTAAARAGYVGLDNRKVGRTAGWYLGNMLPARATAAIFVGSHRYLCQEANEMGFRAYLREHAPRMTLLDPIATLESDRYAAEATLDLLRRAPDLAGLYVAGGGIGGVLEALRQAPAKRRVVIAHDLTDTTSKGLAEGLLHAVLSHPFELVARETLRVLAERSLTKDAGAGFAQINLPLQITTPESL